jgi:hypothetical protein
MIRFVAHRATSSYDGPGATRDEREPTCYTTESMYDIRHEMYEWRYTPPVEVSR